MDSNVEMLPGSCVKCAGNIGPEHMDRSHKAGGCQVPAPVLIVFVEERRGIRQVGELQRAQGPQLSVDSLKKENK